MSELKTLRVCNTQDLPRGLNRKPDFYYFLYDKLVLFQGSRIYDDPYVILDDVPDDPIPNLLYITLKDGYIKIYEDYTIVNIAVIESQEQLELLKQSGTLFFLRSDRRYMDVDQRYLTLPYHNGKYLLTIDLCKDIKINNNTVIRFDEHEGRFFIEGDHAFEDFRRYQPGRSDTVDITIEDDYIRAGVKLSKDPRNIIKVVKDGLYAAITDKVTDDDFSVFKKNYYEYKAILQGYLEDVDEALKKSNDAITSDIDDKIMSAIQDAYGEMSSVFDKYDELLKKVEDMEAASKKYTDDQFAEAVESLNNSTNMNNVWGEF